MVEIIGRISTLASCLILGSAVVATALTKGTMEHRKVYKKMEQLVDTDKKNGITNDEWKEAFRILREELGYTDLQYDPNNQPKYILNLPPMNSYITFRESYIRAANQNNLKQ